MAEPKPSHLGGAYAAWFKDPLLVEAYPARPPYPDGVIQLLGELIVDAPRAVLDVGCGTGELARRIAASVERVDAVDFSEAMLHLGRQLPDGDARNIVWKLGAVEDVALQGPYALVTAGESLHWMDWDVVLRRFADALTSHGVLAIVDRSWDTDTAVWQRLLPIIERHSPVRDYRPYNLVSELVGRDLFEVHGQHRFGPEPWQPTVDEYLTCRHSQRGLSRTHMGPGATAAFDAEVRQAIDELTHTGVIHQHEGQLQLGVEARVTWGTPRAPRTLG